MNKVNLHSLSCAQLRDLAKDLSQKASHVGLLLCDGYDVAKGSQLLDFLELIDREITAELHARTRNFGV